MYFKDRISNYDKYPAIKVNGLKGVAWQEYQNIVNEIKKKVKGCKKDKVVIVVDYYHGTREQEILEGLIQPLQPNYIFHSEEAKLSEEIIGSLLKHNISDDRVFGSLSTHTISAFFDKKIIDKVRTQVELANGLIVVYGIGASLICKGDILMYGDITRWEIQQRYRSKELDNWGVGNFDEDILRKYKRAYFVEWRVFDRHKMDVLKDIDYLFETNLVNMPKMITKTALDCMLSEFSHRPFRLVPYFDEGIWGGRWMEEVCKLERKNNNYAWCFDGVPEENAIRGIIDDIMIELPAMNLVKLQPKALLGGKVQARFGSEFPIRFDFLDTMGGGNLSLQVHPLTEYIQQHFGMPYTQDESYYILDAEERACVYLGVKDGIQEKDLIPALKSAATGEEIFDDTKYINCFPIQKHDHVLIPAGTIHCAGSGAMVLEISATPYIFTMKLWDWGRVGLDGKPRPIHVDRGAKSIQYDRTSVWCEENLIHNIRVLEDTKDIKIERTGLHELEFIETKRYWFKDKMTFTCDESVNMLNLIEGEEACITSPDHLFEPYYVHYAETFIIPESVKQYVIEPSGLSIGKQIAVIKASVRV